MVHPTRRSVLGGAALGVASAVFGSDPAVGRTRARRAGVPTSVATSAAGSTATLTWKRPASNGGSVVTAYVVARDGVDSDGSGPWSTTVSASTRRFAFTELVTGSTYNLTVAAVNAKGTGPAASRPITPAVPPPSTEGAIFAEEFDTFDQSVWWGNLPYFGPGTGAQDPAGLSYNAWPGENGVNPFAIISDPSTSNGSALRVTCRRATAAEQSYLHGRGLYGEAAQWVGGATVTRSSFQLGQRDYANGIYFEWRARFPAAGSGKGMFPALWINDASADGGGASYNPDIQRGAEIDMLEIFGNPPGSPGFDWSTSVWFKTSPTQQGRSSVNAGLPTTDVTGWHTYGIEWTPTVLRFYQDGVQTGDASSHAAYFNGARMDIRLNYTTMGSPGPDNSTPNSLYMDVDYVRTYARRPHQQFVRPS